MPAISVIIPTYNGAHKISGILESLIHQTRQPEEVLVVVDGSIDDTVQVVEQFNSRLPGLRVIVQENQGRASVRNRGAMEATGDLLVFFDDDMLPDQDCLAAHLRLHNKQESIIVTGRQIDVDGATDFQAFRKFLTLKWEAPLLRKSGQPLGKDHLYLTAANFSISRSLFQELGGFDSRLRDAEDFDLAVRAFQSGISVWFFSDALAFHNDSFTSCSYIKRLRQYRVAHMELRRLEPERYRSIPFHEPVVPGGLKGQVFRFFARPGWVRWLDSKQSKWAIPRRLRYLLYDLIVTANGVFFPERVPLK